MGYIYIFTNPSFPQYVKIGYAADVKQRLNELNRSTAVPFAFRVYATYEVDSALSDKKLHSILDKLNPDLRSTEDVDGKRRIREFYAMTPEDAYSILEAIAEINDYRYRLKKWKATATEQREEALAQKINEQHQERMTPFAFSLCNINVGEKIEFFCNGNEHTGELCEVVDDKHVSYNGETWSLTALAKHLTGVRSAIAGPRYFKYNGEWLNTLRAKAEGRTISSRLDDVWIIPCNPKLYDVVGAFDNLNIIEWSQTSNTSVGDTVYIYVGEQYKAIMYKCEVIAADLYGNRSDEDYAYYKDLKKDPDIRYMKLKLIEKYLPEKYPYHELRENGLSSVQGRSKATMQLMKYLEK